ncbi:TldD/PmbA family protein [Acuticoccus sp. MNP-M23]|uniref:TldD/PmbA family protein n=1 Tax=Acuticoccus sp. MNP-M23 TaxID=3072793 RepID=UPI0028164862|nr:TldD/PmbA family protein [Acuticoccus sp. MNP-M23]WMS44735.1 TldD/PmbA family protein [Acuticoccus sp. MNP-M23]
MTTSDSDPLDLTRLSTLATRALDAAVKAGADSADAVVLSGRSLSATVRNGAIEEAEQSEGTDVGLRVFVGARSASVSVGPAANLAEAADRAVAMARAAPEDDSQAIAPADLLLRDAPADLDINDPTAPTMEELIARSNALEAAMLDVAGVTNSGGVSASSSHAGRAMATTNGFAGAYSTSTHGHSATAIAGDGTKMERDHWSSVRRHLADLLPVEDVGRLAAERTVRRLGAEPLSTRTATIIFEPRTASGFVRHLLSAISGSAVARRASFLAGRTGELVYPAGITVRDDPTVRRGMSSRPFDGEGLATAPIDFVQDGILTDYILDLQAARKLGLAGNGRAARGTGSPSPSPTNISVHGGAGDLAALMESAGTGLLVTDLIGMGANIINGNYSRGAAGFWFENGEIVKPVTEITIAGELGAMFRRAVFGDDAPGLYSVDAPTVLLEGMTIGGR